MKAELVKWGNSLAVRIPKPLLEQARLREGDSIELKAMEGKIELRRVERVPALAELVAQIKPENRYSEISTGATVGREEIEW
jgi:antitoxin MazE